MADPNPTGPGGSAAGPAPPDAARREPAAEPLGTVSVTIEEATTTADLERLRPEWERLWAAVPTATPFQHPAWLIPWWKHVAEGDLWTLAVRDGGRLVGLVPLYVYTQPSGSRDVFLLGIATSDYLDALCETPDVVAAALAHLDHHRDRWDVLDLQPLPAASPLRSAVTPPGWCDLMGQADVCPALSFPPTLGGNVVQNLRYYRRRADRVGAVIEPADRYTLAEMYDALQRLHAARWATRDQPGVLATDGVQRAHAESLPQLLDAGLLRMYGLRVGDRIVAVFYGLADGRRVYYYLGGFDPAHRDLSPGTLLIGHAIDAAVADGATAFDFLKGREAYKYLWGATDVPTFTRRLWLPGTRA